MFLKTVLYSYNVYVLYIFIELIMNFDETKVRRQVIFFESLYNDFTYEFLVFIRTHFSSVHTI